MCPEAYLHCEQDHQHRCGNRYCGLDDRPVLADASPLRVTTASAKCQFRLIELALSMTFATMMAPTRDGERGEHCGQDHLLYDTPSSPRFIDAHLIDNEHPQRSDASKP